MASEITDDMVLAAAADVSPAFKQHEKQHMVMLNCCRVPPPNAVELAYHTGLHPHLLCAAVGGRFLDTLCTQAFAGIKKACEKSIDVISLVCYDGRGKYGAAMLGKILFEIIMSDEHLFLNKVSLLVPRDSAGCGFCDECSWWDRRYIDKIGACLTMIQRWKTLKSTGNWE